MSLISNELVLVEAVALKPLSMTNALTVPLVIRPPGSPKLLIMGMLLL